MVNKRLPVNARDDYKNEERKFLILGIVGRAMETVSRHRVSHVYAVPIGMAHEGHYLFRLNAVCFLRRRQTVEDAIIW